MTTATLGPARRENIFSNTLTIARRNLLHIRANPEQLVEMTIQPLMFLVLFVYVFGGAIERALEAAGLSMTYLQFVLPGILVQGIAFTPFTTALGLNKDFQQGLIDRFRSLPIARSAVIGGRIAADGFRIVWSVLIMVGFAVLLGFRFEGGPLGALGAFVLVTAFGLTMCWPMAFNGITADSPESVNTWGFMLILPLTFVSSAFVDPQTMPGWLEAFANVNPVTNVIDATRGLMLGGVFPVAEPLVKSVIWLAIITAVFAPLTIGRYRRRV
jgi:ABC transporter DrrB family efflux protein